VGDDDLTNKPSKPERALAIRFLHSFWQLVAGALLMGGGGAAIYLGWYGASHTRDVTDQLPYLISGGLLGSALVILGGSFYFSFYVSRLHAATRRQAIVLERVIDRLEALQTAQPVTSGASSAADAVLVPAGGKRFHRPGCALVARKQADRLSLEEASERGLQPCKVCAPAA
jgi:hypothetical protein